MELYIYAAELCQCGKQAQHYALTMVLSEVKVVVILSRSEILRSPSGSAGQCARLVTKTLFFNHVVKTRKKSYVHPQNGKNYDIVDQLTAGLKHSGRLIVMASGFPTLKLLKDSWQLWRTQMIATQHGKTAHIPSNHKVHFNPRRKHKDFRLFYLLNNS